MQKQENTEMLQLQPSATEKYQKTPTKTEEKVTESSGLKYTKNETVPFVSIPGAISSEDFGEYLRSVNASKVKSIAQSNSDHEK